MALLTRYINTDNVGSEDGLTEPTGYKTRNSFETGEATDLVAAGDSMLVLHSGATDDLSQGFTSGSWVTGASNTLIFRGDATTGIWDASKYTNKIVSAASFGVGVLGPIYTFWENMQFEIINAAFTQKEILKLNTGSVATDCIMKGDSAATGDYRAFSAISDGRFVNCLAFDLDTSSGTRGFFLQAAGTTADFCMVSGSGDGFRSGSSSVIVNNCLADNCTVPFASTFSGSSDHNAMNGTAPGTNPVDLTAAMVFNDAANDDYRPKVGETADDLAIGGGVTISGITTDLAGVTRPNPPAVGALEPAASGATITSITDPIVTGTSVTLTGTGFEASQGTGKVEQIVSPVTVQVTEDSWADTSVGITSATIESTGLKYGINSFKLTNNSAETDTITSTVNPATGNSFVDLVAPLASSGDRITAVGDLANNDQLRYVNELSGGGGFSVTVNTDGSFSVDGATPDGTYTFEVRAWDTSDQTWGTAANQTVIIGVQAAAFNALNKLSMGLGISL